MAAAYDPFYKNRRNDGRELGLSHRPVGQLRHELAAQAANAAAAVPAPAHTTVLDRRGKPFVVLDELPHLEPERALATVELPLRVDWSPPFTPRELGDRSHRLEVYARLLRDGRAEDIANYVDGDLLLDAWDDMYLPREIRAAWQPVIDAARVRV